MSYTNVETVRRYLLAPVPALERVTDQPVVMADGAAVRFFVGAVDPSTLVVKAGRATIPSRHTVTLSEGTTMLAATPLVPGSVVVATDSSLGGIYQENVDYLVDYAEATLTIKNGGGLQPGSLVAVWYLPYTLCVAGEDFGIDAARGEITRREGIIAAGETVYLDYSPLHLDLSDELVQDAVTTANGMVEREVDPEREFEADATLANAATCRALELLCRAAATRELASLRGGHNVALAWLKLADDYAGRADSMVKLFRAPLAGPRGPVLS